MSEHKERAIEKWGKWALLIAPVVTGMITWSFGFASGFQTAKDDIKGVSVKVDMIEGWKEKQEDFNKVIIAQIATLQAITSVPRK